MKFEDATFQMILADMPHDYDWDKTNEMQARYAKLNEEKNADIKRYRLVDLKDLSMCAQEDKTKETIEYRSGDQKSSMGHSVLTDGNAAASSGDVEVKHENPNWSKVQSLLPQFRSGLGALPTLIVD
jgi:hypothetical protein